jgi:hypothetical protein
MPRATADREVGATSDSIRLGGASLDFQTCETLEAGGGENEKSRVGVYRLPHLNVEM